MVLQHFFIKHCKTKGKTNKTNPKPIKPYKTDGKPIKPIFGRIWGYPPPPQANSPPWPCLARPGQARPGQAWGRGGGGPKLQISTPPTPCLARPSQAWFYLAWPGQARGGGGGGAPDPSKYWFYWFSIGFIRFYWFGIGFSWVFL